MAVLRFDEAKEAWMRGFFESLSEKDQRRYAALQADQLGHGEIVYVAEVLGCSVQTIGRGIDELDQLPDDPASGRVRRPGGGRKKITPGSETEVNLNSLMKTRTAGDPDRVDIIFTDLSPCRLEEELSAMNTPASDDTIRQWLDEQNIGLRKISKSIAGGSTGS